MVFGDEKPGFLKKINDKIVEVVFLITRMTWINNPVGFLVGPV